MIGSLFFGVTIVAFIKNIKSLWIGLGKNEFDIDVIWSLVTEAMFLTFTGFGIWYLWSVGLKFTVN